MTLQERLTLASQLLEQRLKINAPKDTWNLTDNGIRLVQVAPNHWQIIIGGEVAPYVRYTNERHNTGHGVYEGRDNFHWIQNTIDECLDTIKQIMGGTITQDDINSAIDDSNAQIDDLRQQQIDLIKGGMKQ